MLVYHYDELLLLRYTDLDIRPDKDYHKSTSRFMFTLGGGLLVEEV